MYFADNLGWYLVVVGLLGESMYNFFHPAELPFLHWFCCYWLYYLCCSEFGLHFQQVEYSSIVGLMFDIHHFGFCSSGCLIFDADRLFRAVACHYFELDDAYTPHLLARLLCN